MAKIIPAKLAEVTQRKNVSMTTIQKVTGVPVKDIYNDSLSNEELSKISRFLGVNCDFLTRPEITYKDRQDLKEPLDWSLTIPEGSKKKDGTIDKRTLGHDSRKSHNNGYISNRLDKEMIYMISKDKGFSINSLSACTGYHIDIITGKNWKNLYINPYAVINLCYYLDCDPSDIYDGPIDIDNISRRLLTKDKFSINKKYRVMDENDIKAIANRARIPYKFIKEFFDGALMSKDLIQILYNAFCRIRIVEGKTEVSLKDFCNCSEVTMKNYNRTLPKEKEDNAKKLDNVKKVEEKEDQQNNSYASIKRSFIDIIGYLSYEELDAYKTLLESEKMRRDASGKINKYL